MMDGSVGAKTRKKKVAEASAPEAEIFEPLHFSAEDFAAAMRLAALCIRSRVSVPPRLDLIQHLGHAALLAQGLEQSICVRIGNAKPQRELRLPAHACRKFFKPGKSEADVFIHDNSDDGLLTFELDGVTAKFARDTAENFDLAHPLALDPCISIERKVLAHALGLCAPAISTEETRYYLNGVAISPHPSDGTALVFAATDGHRLVKHIVEGLTHSLERTIIIPRAAVGMLRIWLARTEGDGAVDIEVSEIHARFSDAAFLLKTTLVDGVFPDFDRVIPVDCPMAAEVHGPSLRKFLARARAMAKGTGGVGVRFEVDPKRDFIRVSWQSAELGSISQRLDGKALETRDCGFQTGYLADVMNAVESEHLGIYQGVAGDPASQAPAIFATAGELRGPTTLVVMPMRV